MTAFIGDALLVGALLAGYCVVATAVSVCALALWFRLTGAKR